MLLDKYEDAAYIGKGLNDSRYEAPPVILNTHKSDPYIFVRAIPQDKNAPVVIHLVEWSKKPQPFSLSVINARFFSDKEFTVELRVPPEYDKDTHTKAEKSKDFSSLSKNIFLKTTAKDGITKIEIPALSSWGILILKPLISQK